MLVCHGTVCRDGPAGRCDQIPNAVAPKTDIARHQFLSEVESSMEVKDCAQLFIAAIARIDFYWNFYVVMLLAFNGWMFSTRNPFTPRLKQLITVGYLVFVGMTLIGLWSSYTIAEALRTDILALAELRPAELQSTRAVLARHSFVMQRSMAVVVHSVLASIVLSLVWFGPRGEGTSV